MNNIKIYSDFVKFDLFCDQKIELYVNCVPRHVNLNGATRFVYLIEPSEVLDLRYEASFFQGKTYDYLLTHDETLLRNVKNSYLLEFGTCWVRNFTPIKKDYSISFLCGGKDFTPGHRMRKDLWNNEHRITNITKKFYTSGNFKGNVEDKGYPALGQLKNDLFYSQFHVCIENVKSNNWFTEKLIDCFYTKTIPIYWGCPNIDNWFDTQGMIIVNSVDDIIDVSQKLNESLYGKLSPFVHENFARCQKFLDVNENIKNKLLEIINK